MVAPRQGTAPARLDIRLGYPVQSASRSGGQRNQLEVDRVNHHRVGTGQPLDRLHRVSQHKFRRPHGYAFYFSAGALGNGDYATWIYGGGTGRACP